MSAPRASTHSLSSRATPLLLLHHIGARTGTERVNPVAYLADGDRYVIFASKAGAPTNPDWCHNLRAHPDVTIEKLLKDAKAEVLGFERFEVGAGIEKKQEEFVAEVMAQVKNATPAVRH